MTAWKIGVDDRESAGDLNKELSEGSKRKVGYALEEKQSSGFCQASSNLAPANNDISHAFGHPEGLVFCYVASRLYTFRLTHSLSSPIAMLDACRKFAFKGVTLRDGLARLDFNIHRATSNSPGISLMDRPSVVTWRALVYGFLYVAKFRCPLEVSMQVSRLLSLRVCAL